MCKYDKMLTYTHSGWWLHESWLPCSVCLTALFNFPLPKINKRLEKQIRFPTGPDGWWQNKGRASLLLVCFHLPSREERDGNREESRAGRRHRGSPGLLWVNGSSGNTHDALSVGCEKSRRTKVGWQQTWRWRFAQSEDRWTVPLYQAQFRGGCLHGQLWALRKAPLWGQPQEWVDSLCHQHFQLTLGWLEKLLMTFINKRISTLNSFKQCFQFKWR